MPLSTDMMMHLLFSVHFFVFIGLLYKRRDPYYLIVSFTFACLLMWTGLRWLGTEATVAGFAIYTPPRVAAWACLSISLTILAHRRLARKVADSCPVVHTKAT